MHDLLTSAIAGNMSGKSRRRESPEIRKQRRWSGLFARVAAAMAVIAIVAVVIASAPSGGAEFAVAATF